MQPTSWHREDASQPPDSDGEKPTNQDWDDAEKGLYDSNEKLPVAPRATHSSSDDDGRKKSLVIETYLFPTSPIHEGLTPPPALSPSGPRLSLAWPKGFAGQDGERPAPKKPAAPKKKVSRWILFQLWYNTYRKLFTLVTVLNALGILLAALGKFPYADKHSGALVLGNLLAAVLFRNELFLRFLYIVAIYGLRGVSSPTMTDHDGMVLTGFSGRRCASRLGRLRSCSMSAAFTRGARCLGLGKNCLVLDKKIEELTVVKVAHLQDRRHSSSPLGPARLGDCNGRHHQRARHRVHHQCLSVGSQVRPPLRPDSRVQDSDEG